MLLDVKGFLEITSFIVSNIRVSPKKRVRETTDYACGVSAL